MKNVSARGMIVTSQRPVPPRQITLRFPEGEGWALVAALREYAHSHPNAAHREAWLLWATMLDEELRCA